MQRRSNAVVRSARHLLAGARPAAFQLSKRLLSVQKNEPITHNMQYQVTAIARQKYQRAYHHQNAYTNKGRLLATSVAAIATFVLAQESDRSHCYQSSGGQQKNYEELIGVTSMKSDWSKVAGLYEEMIAERLIPAPQTSVWAIAAYVNANEEYKASPIIDSLAENLPNGGARLSGQALTS
eukprot:19458-Heterococcus_DN1.PRE.3